MYNIGISESEQRTIRFHFPCKYLRISSSRFPIHYNFSKPLSTVTLSFPHDTPLALKSLNPFNVGTISKARNGLKY